MDGDDEWRAAGFSVRDVAEALLPPVLTLMPSPSGHHIEDDAWVARRILAKTHDEVGATRWWAVAEVLRTCAAMVKIDRSHRRMMAIAVLSTVRELAGSLPPAHPPTTRGWPDLLAADDLATPVAFTDPLARELETTEWTCPERLADFVDDLRRALVRYIETT